MGDFWTNNSDAIIVGLVMLLAGVLLAKPLEALLKRFGKWLESFFQSLGFGFQKNYYRALVKSHEWLKLIGIYNPSDLHAPRLKEVYISLRLNTAKESPVVVWNRIFNDKEKHMVILGQPGAGKSTLLDYLTLVFAGHINHPLRTNLGNPVPIFVRLRDLGTQPLLQLIESPVNVGLKKVPSGYFERLLKKGKCVVLLDGLDEVLDEKIHKQVVSEITAFANEYPDNWILVTCRVAGWRDQLPDFRQYSVQEFDRDDVRQFIGAWYREVTRTEEVNKLGVSPKPEQVRDAEERAYQVSLKQTENLWGALLKNESLLRIARTPLILSLVTLVHKNRTADLPKGRARLYRECLDILLDIWDSKDKGIVLPDAPSPNDKLFVLKTIAFHYVEQGLLEMDIDGLEKLVEPLLKSLTKPVSARSLIRQIYERSGVLVEQAIGKFGFAHRALHDYLAASHIAEQNMDALLVNHAAEERWREVILIAIGLVQPKQRAETLLGELLRRSDESPASLALAGWSLAEDIQVSEGLRDSVRTKILHGLENTSTPADFALLSSALVDTDLAAVQSWIGSVLSGRNPYLQEHVLTSLIPEMGLEQAEPFLPILKKVMIDPNAEINLRIHCILAVAKLKPVMDADLIKMDAYLRTSRTSSPPQSRSQTKNLLDYLGLEWWNAFHYLRGQPNLALKAAATWALCELGFYEGLGLVKIPAGEFLMGSSGEDKSAHDNEKPQHTLYLPTYYIAKYPVTADEYRAFVKESGHKSKGNNRFNGIGNHPVVYVTWYDALAFAQWKGMTLPSEAEWEKAARGTDGRIYPWGNDWQSGLANTSDYWSSARGWWTRLSRWMSETTTTPVGFFSPSGDSPYGCVDMSGNVWEWTRSAFKPYPYDANDDREDENADKYVRRVVRGGSFDDDSSYARCASRPHALAFYLNNNIGFRVVASHAFPSYKQNLRVIKELGDLRQARNAFRPRTEAEAKQER